ncbi:hypothetical protein BJ508DRAFT_366741 [Ascobolus immersus RN42]|uniref:Uncharacterized protein n=1 Tax=Ascobolus immersus RN42 TaxID=1160509 RepID=A0A3N4HUQ6_ASCIM|nr:hypothetical protein BJ508DRAFT_366741 [Ascobolus immersus RN42]
MATDGTQDGRKPSLFESHHPNEPLDPTDPAYNNTNNSVSRHGKLDDTCRDSLKLKTVEMDGMHLDGHGQSAISRNPPASLTGKQKRFSHRKRFSALLKTVVEPQLLERFRQHLDGSRRDDESRAGEDSVSLLIAAGFTKSEIPMRAESRDGLLERLLLYNVSRPLQCSDKYPTSISCSLATDNPINIRISTNKESFVLPDFLHPWPHSVILVPDGGLEARTIQLPLKALSTLASRCSV